MFARSHDAYLRAPHELPLIIVRQSVITKDLPTSYSVISTNDERETAETHVHKLNLTNEVEYIIL